MMPLTAKNHTHRTPPALRIIIAGGGTGGHLFPGIAIAQEFVARNPDTEVLFVGTGKPFEISVLSAAGFKQKKITAEGIKARGLVKQIVSICKIPRGIYESILILRGFKPDLVVGVGGYAAGPLVMSAWLLRIRIALHEQNILMGITNRVLSRIADRVFVSFENTHLDINSRNVRITGNPVRREILQSAGNQNTRTVEPSGKPRPFTILILGGSQGAHGLNLALMEAVKHIKKKEAFFFIHQTGPQDASMVQNAYQSSGIAATVQAFFPDMARQYQKADLVICRAGATTVAEITAIGKGVVLVPFPFAADNHQVLNARTLTDAGAAEMILQHDLDGRLLADKIEYFGSNPEALSRMASRARSIGRPHAAKLIMDDCYRLVDSSN
jgi:UDP-N-acetylglucosamine--N-acetylmuramyl-(pentapeptide) pyrophosphoryl-undecaprenol N-acetylglucosamine transferase